MTKQDLQKELKEKVREGIKPSDLRSKLSSFNKGDDLKKLKRSKSADDIPPAPTSIPLSKSKSSETSSFTDPKYPYTTLILQQQTIEKLTKESQAKSDTISLLRKKIESSEKEPKLTELDQHLIARHKSLKDWFSQYQKNKQLDKELSKNIDEASEELIAQDKLITSLRGENRKLKQEKQSLQKDLELTSKLAESRKVPYCSPEDKGIYLKYAFYSLLALGFTVWLVKSTIPHEKL